MKRYIVAFIVIILVVLPLFSSVSADNGITVNINVSGEETQTRYERPVLVAGIWYYINISTEIQALQEVSLKLYNGSSIPSIDERNEANYYEWNYNENSQAWIDVVYDGTYIDNASCIKNNNIYSFYVGIEDTFPSEIAFYNENWTLEVYTDENKVYSENVVVEKPTIGIAKTHADIIKFYVDPFTEMDAYGDDYFTVGNKGNLPLKITVNYGSSYNNIIEYENFNTDVSPFSNSDCYITLHSESWKPGIRSVGGNMYAQVPESHIITTAFLNFNSNVSIDPSNLKIFVGHDNHEIVDISGTGITFQYEKSLNMGEGEKKDITAYLSGNGAAILDIWSDEKNISILKISSEGNEVHSPFTITSTDTSEHAIAVRVEALRENHVGLIYYKVEIDGEIQTFITTISVGPPSSQNEETSSNPPSIMTIVVVLGILLVIGYMISSHLRHRRR